MKLSHESIEINAGLMIVLTPIAISIGGWSKSCRFTTSRTRSRKSTACVPTRRWSSAGVTSTSARAAIPAISQMIRPFRDEHMRYGHYSLAAESKYDHPFQWGSKRTGPDLGRVGASTPTPGTRSI